MEYWIGGVMEKTLSEPITSTLQYSSIPVF
jgi:hypothetical protein